MSLPRTLDPIEPIVLPMAVEGLAAVRSEGGRAMPVPRGQAAALVGEQARDMALVHPRSHRPATRPP